MDEYSKARYMNFSSSLNESSETSALARMQQQYWTTKQAVFKRLGKKEDDCIIASDLELDLKLELYQTIEESFLTLMRVLENYQEKLCILAQEENALGRFLKENSKKDKTKAGKAMSSAGSALSYSAQQRLTLRIPLVRLYQEVETFQYRAIVDTLQTVEKMEKARTAYRGSLMWMKDVSQQLDPDTCKQMEKFRKVQGQVRKAKQRFDKMKLDTLQKVDLLSFSRCNLFSQALAAYQNALLNVSKKIAQSSSSVASMTKGYQHYEFSMLKELTETSRKLAEETSELKPHPAEDKDTIIFFDAEYHDDVDAKNLTQLDNENKLTVENQDSAASKQSTSSLQKKSRRKNGLKATDGEIGETEGLLDLKECSVHSSHLMEGDEKISVDDLLFLDDLAQPPITDMSTADENIFSDWQAAFDETATKSTAKSSVGTEPSVMGQNSIPSFLPSQLLDVSSDLTISQMNAEAVSGDITSSYKFTLAAGAKESNSCKGKTQGKQDMTTWFNLFADLDPLANPDLVGERKGNYDDRNC